MSEAAAGNEARAAEALSEAAAGNEARAAEATPNKKNSPKFCNLGLFYSGHTADARRTAGLFVLNIGIIYRLQVPVLG